MVSFPIYKIMPEDAQEIKLQPWKVKFKECCLKWGKLKLWEKDNPPLSVSLLQKFCG